MFSSWRSCQRNSSLAVESGGVELLLNSLFLFIWRLCELWLSRLPSSQLLLEAMSQFCGPPVVNKWQAKLILAFTMHATLLLFSFSSTSDLLNGFFFFPLSFKATLNPVMVQGRISDTLHLDQSGCLTDELILTCLRLLALWVYQLGW